MTPCSARAIARRSRARSRATARAFPDLEMTVLDCFAAGDKVVCRWSAVGTFESELMGQEPTGEKGEPVEGISIDRFDEDGKVVEAWGQWDVVRFMRNIGAIPDEVATPA